MHRAGPAARTLDERVAQLEGEPRRVERERDILKKALAILSQHAWPIRRLSSNNSRSQELLL